MRKVFPLKTSDNCEYGTAEESQDKEVGIRKMEAMADKSMKPKATGEVQKICDSSDIHSSGIANGDENLPNTSRCNDIHDIIPLADKPSTIAGHGHKTHRASAYPVFTAASSVRSYNSSSMRHSDKQRLTTVNSTHYQSSNSLTKQVAKEAVPSDNSEARPLISTTTPVRNNRVSLTNPQQQKTSFRSSSLRIDSQPPDRTLFPFHYDEEPAAGSCSQAFDSSLFLRSRSVSRTTSEMSYSETSSDCGSCFTKTTADSNSSSSGKSESIISMQSSGTPFNLTARSVAEKLIKVLGKERLHWQANRRSRTPVESPNDRRYNGGGRNEIAPASTVAFSDSMPSTPDANDRSFHSSINSGREFSIRDSTKVRQQRKGSFDDIGSSDHPNLQDLEARAAAKDAEVAALLEQESNERYTREESRKEWRNGTEQDGGRSLEQEISRLRREKRDLTLEVAREIRDRIAEKKAAVKASRRMETEMERKISAVEKDKSSVQEALEMEMERRTEEWSSKLGKIKTEERKMMERLAKMAEEKNELQKEVADLKGKEETWKDEVKECRESISGLKKKLEERDEEIRMAMERFSEMEKRLEESICEVEKKKEMEMENAEMQKEVKRLRRMCNEQEKTIDGLWREFDEAVNNSFECRSEHTVILQRELLRLAHAEQDLRNELNSVHTELNSLRRQLREDPPSSSSSSCLLLVDDAEINGVNQNSLQILQTKLASVQKENKRLSLDLRTALREKKDLERRSLLLQKQCEDEDEDEDEEAMVSKQKASNAESQEVGFLESKVKSREAEIEELCEEMGKMESNRESLQMEVEEMEEKLSKANNRIRELERKMEEREEMIERIEREAEKSRKETKDMEGELKEVKKQRDEMRREAECMSEEAVRLTLEVAKLRTVTDKLEDEVMLKEGQISILRTGSSTDYPIHF